MGSQYEEVKFEGTPEEVNSQWLEARKKGVGGSDVAAIMGISKYSSPLSIWLVKTGREESPDLSSKQSVEWGSRLEPVVAGKFAEEHPELKVEEPGCMFVSKDRPWAVASVDYVLTDAEGRKGVLEVKTVGLRSAGDWDEGVPAYYMTQVVHYLAVTGFEYAWVAVLIGGQEYREYAFGRDEDDVKAVSDAVDAFWNKFVKEDAIPELVGSEDESGALSRMFEEPSGEMVYMLDSELPDIDELEKQRELKKEIDVDIRRRENAIKVKIGDAKGIETETKRINWVRYGYMKLDTRKLKSERPDIVEEFSSEATRDGGIRISKKKEA